MYSLLQLRKSIPLMIFIGLTQFAQADEKQQPISISDIVKTVTAQGYNDIRKIELSHDDGEYEVKARRADGKKVEIDIDAYTGKILEVERD